MPWADQRDGWTEWFNINDAGVAGFVAYSEAALAAPALRHVAHRVDLAQRQATDEVVAELLATATTAGEQAAITKDLTGAAKSAGAKAKATHLAKGDLQANAAKARATRLQNLQGPSR